MMVKRAVTGCERPIGRGQEASWRVWEARRMVKRPVRGSERLLAGSRGQPEGLDGRLEDLGARQRVWEANQGVWRVKFRGTEKRSNVETKKRRLKSSLCGTKGH